MGDDITIGVTEIVNNIEVTAQPNDKIVDISVIDNTDEVTLNITPTVIEINVNKGSSYAKWGTILGTLSDQEDLQDALDLKANLVDGKVPASELPSYVDDVIEVSDYASLPATGEISKIYVTLDNNKIYRWSGSIYIEIASNQAIWGSITGTLSNQTDLQNALNLKANDNEVVHLTGDETITGTKSFNSSTSIGIRQNNSGNGYGIYSENASNGFGYYVANNGSGKAISVANALGSFGNMYEGSYNGTLNYEVNYLGEITGAKFVKSGGTSSQFLKADGSVDSTSYLPLTGGTVTGTLNFDGSGATTPAITSIFNTGINRLLTPVLRLYGTDNISSKYIELFGSLATTNRTIQFPDASGTVILGSGTTNYLAKWSNGNTVENSQIFDNGTNVGIGTTSPTNILHIAGDAFTNSRLVLERTSGAIGKYTLGVQNTNGQFGIADESSGTSVDRFVIGPTGNVGIGTTSPSYKLHVNGSVAGTSAYVNLSDKRHKKDILPIENALDKILALNGVTFNWDKESTDINLDDNNHIGLLAQDVEQIIPQAVVTAEDENETKSVAYTDIVPVLIEAIKELKAEIELLKAK